MNRTFVTTHWSVVLAAADQDASPDAGDALAELCRAYWYPLYAHARRRGHDHHAPPEADHRAHAPPISLTIEQAAP